MSVPSDASMFLDVPFGSVAIACRIQLFKGIDVRDGPVFRFSAFGTITTAAYPKMKGKIKGCPVCPGLSTGNDSYMVFSHPLAEFFV
jgi:hypothetical protein